MKSPTLLQQSLPLLLLALVMVLADWAGPQLASQLQYDRVAVNQGQWWRLFSAHLLHTNHWHLLMNLAGLLVIFLMHGPHYCCSRLLFLMVSGFALIGLLLWLWSPATSYYVGLSGWLHALLVWGACKDIQRQWSSGWLILAGVCAKIGWEQWQGASQQLITLINAEVATDAHLYGAISGLLLYLLSLSYQYWRNDLPYRPY